MTESLAVQNLYADLHLPLKLSWIAGREGGMRTFAPPDDPIDCTGATTLVSHFNVIRPNQVQVLGGEEVHFLYGLNEAAREDVCRQLFKSESRVIIIAEGETVSSQFIELADHYRMPLLTTPIPSNTLIDDLHYYLGNQLAQHIILHGVFMEVLGIGMLLTGESGVGKSELALELISRGHRLIADDAPEFARVAPDAIQGTCPRMLSDFLEVRGLGVLNIRVMYGDNAIKARKHLRLIIHLATEHLCCTPDRLKVHQHTRNVLGLDIPCIHLPVAPGRNLAVLVEVAIRNHLLCLRGYDAAQDFISHQPILT